MDALTLSFNYFVEFIWNIFILISYVVSLICYKLILAMMALSQAISFIFKLLVNVAIFSYNKLGHLWSFVSIKADNFVVVVSLIAIFFGCLIVFLQFQHNQNKELIMSREAEERGRREREEATIRIQIQKQEADIKQKEAEERGRREQEREQEDMERRRIQGGMNMLARGVDIILGLVNLLK